MSAMLHSIMEVSNSGLCVECGACSYLCRQKKMKEFLNVDQFSYESSLCKDCDHRELCLSVCPGAFVDLNQMGVGPSFNGAEHEFGKALEIWEGYSTDPAMRYRGSSGGVVSALASYCVELGSMNPVLHTAGATEKPWNNVTVTSSTRTEIVSRAGSRYSPSSPCDGLSSLEENDKPGVFIGKPCDVAALAAITRTHPALNKKIGLTLSLFCAGTPNSLGTLELLASIGVEPHEVKELRYRGAGWPGKFQVTSKDGRNVESISYAETWSKLGKFRPLRCSLCPDGMGNLADISCGDAWEQYSSDQPNAGISLVLVRTPRGRDVLHGAIEAGYVTLRPVTKAAVFAAQPSLIRKHREVFGRLLALRILGIPIPHFTGSALFQSWLKLPWSTKIRSVAGTMRRGILRGWWKHRAKYRC